MRNQGLKMFFRQAQSDATDRLPQIDHAVYVLRAVDALVEECKVGQSFAQTDQHELKRAGRLRPPWREDQDDRRFRHYTSLTDDWLWAAG